MIADKLSPASSQLLGPAEFRSTKIMFGSKQRHGSNPLDAMETVDTFCRHISAVTSIWSMFVSGNSQVRLT